MGSSVFSHSDIMVSFTKGVQKLLGKANTPTILGAALRLMMMEIMLACGEIVLSLVKMVTETLKTFCNK